MKRPILFSISVFSGILSILIIWIILIPSNNLTSDNSLNLVSENKSYRSTILHNFQKNKIKLIMHELEEIQSSRHINQTLVLEAIKQYGSSSIEVKNLSETKYIVDMIHLKKVTEIIDKHGWLGTDKIGSQNNYTLFVTIQNADFETQDKYLGIMEAAVKSGTLSAEHFANLVDRKALAQHQQQIYGTQFSADSKSGTYYFAPIIAESTVNKRRAEIGLSSLRDYAAKSNVNIPLLQKTI